MKTINHNLFLHTENIIRIWKIKIFNDLFFFIGKKCNNFYQYNIDHELNTFRLFYHMKNKLRNTNVFLFAFKREMFVFNQHFQAEHVDLNASIAKRANIWNRSRTFVRKKGRQKENEMKNLVSRTAIQS